MNEMEDDSKLEFKKLTMAFTEIREALFQREVLLKKELHQKIREAQESLKEDHTSLQTIREQLKTLKEAATSLKIAF